MPKRLLDRCQSDSIDEFQLAAHQRYLDGLSAASAGRRTAAIYLWGYAAEMTLKAAYFRVSGFAPKQAITAKDRKSAVQQAGKLNIAWPTAGQGHNVRAWAELLVATRSSTAGQNYSTAQFGREVQVRGQRLEKLWNETLRYHKNRAYPYEVEQVLEAVSWLLAHSPKL